MKPKRGCDAFMDTCATVTLVIGLRAQLLQRPVTSGMIISIAVLLLILVLVFIAVVRRSR
jgi:hypothetical protein